MEIITVDQNNLEKEHICCAISSNNDIQVKAKKAWLEEQFKCGLIFKKMDVRGKCFIEYLPLEEAWVPIVGDDLMHINCLWVSGKYQGQGLAKKLLEACIEDCRKQKKHGITVISAKRKMPFVMDYKFLIKHGFISIMSLDKYELMYLSLDSQAVQPSFTIKEMTCEEGGLVLYYSHQCPFTAKYTPMIEAYCQEKGLIIKLKLLNSSEEAKNAGILFTTYSLFYNHKFITREILSVKKFEKILEELI